MVKVTLNKNLVPYPREVAARHNCHDLTQNYYLACQFIRATRILFQLRKDTAVFSGYAHPSPSGSFAIRIFHKGRVVRKVVLKNLGYAGTLRVEITTQKVEESVKLDLLASLSYGGMQGRDSLVDKP
jgi:hypothetical protein